MKKFFFAAFSAAILFSCTSKKEENKDDKTNGTEKTAGTTDTKKPDNAPKPDSAEMMKRWQEYMTPGDVHKMMASWDGAWSGEVTSWEHAEAQPQKSTLASTNKMVMNGLYQESTHAGNMMGMPFQGKGTMGYDNVTKKFTSTWIDNMGSGLMTMTGTWDDASKSMTLKGTGTNPITKGDCEMREVYKIIDDKTHLMEMYRTDDGKEFKTMEIKFSKK